MPTTNHVRFFLGSNTKRGFVPLFEETRNAKEGMCLYILKGGAGSGKSSLMKKIAAALEKMGDFVEYIPCASDPSSLDAIIDVQRGIAMVDGTPPHALEAKFPGAYEKLLNPGEAWDCSKLQEEKEKIMELSDEISRCHATATAYIQSATALLDFACDMAASSINHSTLTNFADAFLTDQKNETGKRGKEYKRLLSAVSVGRIAFFDTTLTILCDTLYALPDPYGAASHAMLSLLREKALGKGLDVISCYSSLCTPDKLDHLILPQLRIGITTENAFHRIKGKEVIPVENLYTAPSPFLEKEGNLCIQTGKTLLETACAQVKKAKLLHDDLEKIYASAMDFSQMDEMYATVLGEILSR